ncbi:MAG: phosphosulfolactate synthase [Streptosporangiaceae bacterium]
MRAAKPRRSGITHILDRGVPLSHTPDPLAMTEPYVDAARRHLPGAVSGFAVGAVGA